MERLTTETSIMGRKHDIKRGLAAVWKRKIKNDRYELIEEVVDKLGQLEDIEEEIGIELITKDKVEKNRYVFVGYQNSIEINQVEIKKYGRLGIDIYDKNAVFKYNYLPYKDYGKTWALTREELENE